MLFVLLVSISLRRSRELISDLAIGSLISFGYPDTNRLDLPSKVTDTNQPLIACDHEQIRRPRQKTHEDLRS